MLQWVAWAQLGIPHLGGLSCDYCQMMAGAGAIWRLDWAGYPRWLVHITGNSCWLSTGSLVGAVNQSAYKWPIRVAWDSHTMVSGFWGGVSEEKTFQEIPMEAAVFLMI